MWLAKPIYESLPAVLVAVGILALLCALYVDRWLWDEVLALVGVLDVIAGVVLLLRRRGYRASRSRLKFDDSQRTP